MHGSDKRPVPVRQRPASAAEGDRRAGPAGLCVAGDVAASSFLQYLMCMVHRYMAFTYIRIDEKLSEVPV